MPRHIAAFVLPFSMSFNTTGSNLFIALAAVFCAQAAGVELTMNQLGVLLLTLFLTTKGIGRGSPRFSCDSRRRARRNSACRWKASR